MIKKKKTPSRIKPGIKPHGIFTLALAAVLILAIALVPEYSLFAASGFLVLYVSGNGIIHYKRGQLSRDTLIEYCLVAAAALVVLIGALL